jgi:hypothetical protein
MTSVRANRPFALLSVALGAVFGGACSDSGSGSAAAVDASVSGDAGAPVTDAAPAIDAATATDAATVADGGALADAASTADAAPSDSGAPATDAGLRCTAEATDDGTAEAVLLAARNISCGFRSNAMGWETASAYCANLGSNWRLASKAVALKVASNPEVCRIAVPAQWLSWTSTCAGGNLAWVVDGSGNSTRSSTTGGTIGVGALCIRNP